MRPGAGALLEITYVSLRAAMPEVGLLSFNGQRKIVFVGKRYHAVYHKVTAPCKYTSEESGCIIGDPEVFLGTACHIDVDSTDMTDTLLERSMVYYLRSGPVDTTFTYNQIPWENIVLISDNIIPGHGPIERHVFPSIAVSKEPNGEIAVGIVWSAHEERCFQIRNCNQGDVPSICMEHDSTKPCPSSDEKTAYVLMHQRSYDSNGNFIRSSEPQITVISKMTGLSHDFWGTPVISSIAPSSYIVAWSDKNLGIVKAKVTSVRKTGGINDSLITQNRSGIAIGKHPSISMNRLVAYNKNSCALVWEGAGALLNGNAINYVRLDELGSPIYPIINIANPTTLNRFPSTERTQDLWGRIQDGVTWQTSKLYKTPLKNIESIEKHITFVSLYTPDIGRTQLWHSLSFLANNNNTSVFPNTTSLNSYQALGNRNDSIMYSIVYNNFHPVTNKPLSMHEMHVRYADDFSWKEPRDYTYNGVYPNASASLVNQRRRLAVMNEYPSNQSAGHTVEQDHHYLLVTTKEFFAKMEKPDGYWAEGREALFNYVDPITQVRTNISIWLDDVWFANKDTAMPVGMSQRHIPNTPSNTISDIENLLTSKEFHSSDSTYLGFIIRGKYFNSGNPNGKNITAYVDLLHTKNGGGKMITLDSFTISFTNPNYDTSVTRCMVLPPDGGYKIGVRLASTDLPADTVAYPNVYLVTDIGAAVGTLPSAFFKRSKETAIKNWLSLSPNPFKTSTKAIMGLNKKSYVSVYLYDNQGNLVRQEVGRSLLESGEYEFEIFAQDLPSGTYVLHLQTDESKMMQKIIIEK